ncbi:MAG: class I SAM-dependent methyltransferase [candidate division WOR-3 bacterium]
MSWQERYESRSPIFRFYPIRKTLILKNLPEKGMILEIGAGPGVFPELAGRIIALDANQEILKQGSYARACGKNESLPFGNGSFDAVVATGTLEYSILPDALFETRRVLKKGGLFLATFANRLSFRRIWDREVYLPLSSCLKTIARKPAKRPIHWQMSAHEAGELLRQTGFNPIRVEFFDANPLPRPTERLCPLLTNWLSDLLEPHAHALIANQFLVVGVKS